MRFTFDDITAAYVCACAWENEKIWDFANGARYMIFGAYGPAVKTAPKGNIGDITQALYVADAEAFEKISPWLNGYTGEISYNKTFFCSLNP